MSEVRASFGQFLKVQKEQNELLKKIASKEGTRQELDRQYKQNQERLEELHKQLFAEIF